MSRQHCENYDVRRETVHCYPRNVDRCCWNLGALFKICFRFVLLYNKWKTKFTVPLGTSHKVFIASFCIHVDHRLHQMAFFIFAKVSKGGTNAGFHVLLKYFERKKAFRYYIKQIDAKLPCAWFSSDTFSDTLAYASCATFLFLPHFDVICDLLLNRRTATWNYLSNRKSVA